MCCFGEHIVGLTIGCTIGCQTHKAPICILIYQSVTRKTKPERLQRKLMVSIGIIQIYMVERYDKNILRNNVIK